MSNDERFPVCVVCLSRCSSPVGGTEPQDNADRRCCVCGHPGRRRATCPACEGLPSNDNSPCYVCGREAGPHNESQREIVLTDGPTADLAYATLLDWLESGAFL